MARSRASSASSVSSRASSMSSLSSLGFLENPSTEEMMRILRRRARHGKSATSSRSGGRRSRCRRIRDTDLRKLLRKYGRKQTGTKRDRCERARRIAREGRRPTREGVTGLSRRIRSFSKVRDPIVQRALRRLAARHPWVRDLLDTNGGGNASAVFAAGSWSLPEGSSYSSRRGAKARVPACAREVVPRLVTEAEWGQLDAKMRRRLGALACAVLSREENDEVAVALAGSVRDELSVAPAKSVSEPSRIIAGSAAAPWTPLPEKGSLRLDDPLTEESAVAALVDDAAPPEEEESEAQAPEAPATGESRSGGARSFLASLFGGAASAAPAPSEPEAAEDEPPAAPAAEDEPVEAATQETQTSTVSEPRRSRRLAGLATLFGGLFGGSSAASSSTPASDSSDRGSTEEESESGSAEEESESGSAEEDSASGSVEGESESVQEESESVQESDSGEAPGSSTLSALVADLKGRQQDYVKQRLGVTSAVKCAGKPKPEIDALYRAIFGRDPEAKWNKRQTCGKLWAKA